MSGRTIRSMQRASQRRDTREEIRDRSRRSIASAKAVEDRLQKFPRLDASNADAAIDYQEERYRLHYNELRKEGL